MNHDRLVSKFSQTVGVEKAASIVADGLDALGIDPKSSYSPREVEDICLAIEERNEGYVGLVAHEIRVHQQAQQHFEALLERISDPVVVVEFEDDVPLISWMNPAFKGTFGADSDAVGSRVSDVVAGEGTGHSIEDWMAVTDDTEVRCQTADGESRTFIFRSVVVTRAGGRTEGYGIYVDITDRKRRERMLANQNEQLERFASVVSHDLRNPLNVADGHVELALEKTESDEVRTHLEYVSSAHDRMSGLIETLLTLAREGQTVDDPDPVPLEPVAVAAWSHVDTGDAALETDGLEGRAVAADRDRFEQLLENLVRNAVEHASTGADADATVTIGVLREGDEPIGFYVEDDGPGVPEVARDRVFDHGYSTQDEGTGFGLAIVETIAEAHGWIVSLAEPDPERGARFEFTDVEFID